MLKQKFKLFTISEVVKMFVPNNTKKNNISTHTLRFWESKFRQLKPKTLLGGRRYYSEKDIDIIKMIFFLLKEQGLTINGAIKVMNERPKELDGSKSLSIKGVYYKKIIKLKSKKILEKIKKLNGKKNTYKSKISSRSKS